MKFRYPSLPRKRVGSVRTEIAAAPAASYSRAMETGSNSGSMSPFEGDAFLHSQMNDISGNSQYDVARKKWGSTWRIPTKSELEEIEDECTWKWTTQGDRNGYKVTGPNGNSIFLPATGYFNGSSLYNVGERGDYWSSTPYDNGSYASIFNFNSSGRYQNWDNRYYGLTVRPVSE